MDCGKVSFNLRDGFLVAVAQSVGRYVAVLETVKFGRQEYKIPRQDLLGYEEVRSKFNLKVTTAPVEVRVGLADEAELVVTVGQVVKPESKAISNSLHLLKVSALHCRVVSGAGTWDLLGVKSVSLRESFEAVTPALGSFQRRAGSPRHSFDQPGEHAYRSLSTVVEVEDVALRVPHRVEDYL